MKFGNRQAKPAALALLSAILVVLLVSACGGGGGTTTGSAGTPAAGTATSDEAESAAVAEGAASEPWTLENANLQNTRAVASGITADNVGSLRPAWMVETNGSGNYGSFSANPVVDSEGKTVFLQDLSNDVFAVGLESGKIEWEYDFPPDASNLEGPNGVVYYEGGVYGETNTSAFAIDAKTGKLIWETPGLAENEGQGFNIQPQAAEGKIYLSTSGQTNGGLAYGLDAKTGKVLWKFQETKEAKDRKVGGVLGNGGAWNAPAVGPEGEVIFGVGNPYRSIDEAFDEPGDVLYNDSTVSLDPDTGRMNWYMQGVANDFHDWDMQVSPIYVEETEPPMIIDGGKMGYVYSMDPKTGKLNWKVPVGRHNGKDEESQLALEGKLKKKPKVPYVYYPGALGGIETDMAVAEGVAFVAVNDLASKFKNYEEPVAGFAGSPAEGTGEMVAVDLKTGKVKWDTKLPSSPYGAATYSNGVVYTTTFEGKLMAFDAKTGKVLWSEQMPAGANAPIAISGEYLITAAAYPEGPDEKAVVIAYKVGVAGRPVESTLVAKGANGGLLAEVGSEMESEGAGQSSENQEAQEAESAANPLAIGEGIFDVTCSSCHTLAAAGATGSVGPDLDQLMPDATTVEKQVTNGGGGMPAFGGSLSKAEIKDVAGFVSHWAGRKLTAPQRKLAKENATAGGP